MKKRTTIKKRILGHSKSHTKGASFARTGLLRPKHKHQGDHIKFAWMSVVAFVALVLPQIGTPLLQKVHVLGYATGISTSGLLAGTNAQRGANGVGGLSLNSQLNNAAQAKANDMATRNYWSHNTPEGNPPWVFFTAAGYSYSKAGENLAYGFNTSDDTIVGWMNSPSHRANLLDSAFTEVGFGMANSANYQSNGEQTVVVAMYAKPYYTPPATCPAGQTGTPPNCVTPQPVATTPATTQPTQQAPVSQQPTETPTEQQPQPTEAAPAQETPKPEQPKETVKKADTVTAYTNENTQEEAAPPVPISRIQQFTRGKAPWSTYVVSVAMFVAVALWVAKHGYVLHKVLVQGESFVVHHPLLDIALIIFIVTAYMLTRSVGFIH